MIRRLARRLIDAIQNTLLDRLFPRLLLAPYLVLFAWFDKPYGRNGEYRDVMGLGLGCVLVAWVFCWAIGVLVIYERPKGRLVLERIQDAPRNGYEVWSTPPAGGLRPPALTKAIVMALGRPSPPVPVWGRWLLEAIRLGAFAILILNYVDPRLLSRINPSLADRNLETVAIWVVAAFLSINTLRDWAVESRKRLESGNRTPS